MFPRPVPTLILSFIFPCIAHAGAVVAQQQQIKAMREQQQIAAYQQAIAERQAAEVAAYQQAVAQYQQAQLEQARQMIIQQIAQQIIAQQIQQFVIQRKMQIQAVQQAQLKQAVEEALARKMATQIAQGMVIKQVQEQMVAQAVAEAAQRMMLQQAYQQQAVGQAVAAQQMAQMQAGQMQAGQMQAMQQQAMNDTVEEVVDIAQVWNKMDTNSRPWALLIDPQSKVMTVNEYIERIRSEGVRINKAPAHYAELIDEMSQQDPQMLNQPFQQIMQMLAVMEYDYDNGTDRDALARRLLGPDLYASNRKRLGK